MSQAKVSELPDRGVVSVTGPDAAKLLQGLITNDMSALATRPALFAGLLSPQGKILFDFIVAPHAGGFLLDCAKRVATDLAKRLTLYKLRAAVEIKDASAAYAVLALWGDSTTSSGETAGSVSFPDPRIADLGTRILAERRFVDDISSATNGEAVDEDAYHAHRIAIGVPEGGQDFAFGDAFPHEACMDQLNGVSFTKGCYVGQEIVARMEHRGTARKRVVPVQGDRTLPAAGTDVKAGDVSIGTLGTSSGERGLAMMRLDRAAEFKEKGVPLTAGDVMVALKKPAWAGFDLTPASAGTA